MTFTVEDFTQDMEVDVVVTHREKWDEKKEPDGFIIDGKGPQATSILDEKKESDDNADDNDDDIVICDEEDLVSHKRKADDDIEAISKKSRSTDKGEECAIVLE